MEFDTVFIIGPQGSGKGTQARKLATRLGFFYWEMGGIIREISSEDSAIGKKAKALHDQGVLFPDDFLIEIATRRLTVIPKDQGIVFDGVPRRLGQAEFLLDYLKQQGRTRFITLFVDIPREDSINRLLLRAQIEDRKDDTREAIEFRLDQYEQDTLPVLDFLRQHSELVTIDGRPAIDEVTAAINLALGQREHGQS